MLPVVSGILPDNSDGLKVALFVGVPACFAIWTKPAGSMPAVASRMLALPCFIATETLPEPCA